MAGGAGPGGGSPLPKCVPARGGSRGPPGPPPGPHGLARPSGAAAGGAGRACRGRRPYPQDFDPKKIPTMGEQWRHAFKNYSRYQSYAWVGFIGAAAVGYGLYALDLDGRKAGQAKPTRDGE